MREALTNKRLTGRRMTKERAEFRRLAQSTEVGTVTRGQLAVLSQSLPCTGLITSTESHLLTVIINTARGDAFDKGGRPIVFKSNNQLGFEINRSPGRVSRILSRLFDAGLVTMQDSANFKRYPIRDGEGEISDACGIDLRLLIARYRELDALVRQKREEKRASDAAARRFRDALRSARYALVNAADLTKTALASLASRIDRVAAFVGIAGRAPAFVLRRAASLLEWLVGRSLKASRRPQSVSDYDNMTCTNVENDMHKQITNPHPFDLSKEERRPAHAGQHNSVKAGYASKRAFEESLTRGSDPDNRQSRPQQGIVALDDVWRAAPSLKDYFTTAPRSWSDLARIAPQICRLAGISEDARLRAVDQMGQQVAAIAVAVTFEKHSRQEVSSPGGYLRAMTDRAASGDLHLSRSVFGLAARNSMEALN
ncbi:replication initiation protein (plasmid) [Agrobacterium vitis]|uniref:plasmid replication protein RepC n=1 Tax=Rhizobium/Agrobacterium group TaxID=227290 RepID=UPI0015744BF8|nr:MULTISPECIES: plasmid replication protein RepC [Rhizobium/Agrobacterium group]NTF22745.1 replication protein C [Agrobacterium rubi]MDX8316000.1 plasmid replication protein RepC [Agrobacterium rosae]NTF29602.1 replication protein C [Agrobacterium rubi]WCK17185.1 plasmid replication protein RepC [Agrobacterium tumefaciens]BCH62648.1 replication initiation protein [Agrobacterium vitis]